MELSAFAVRTFNALLEKHTGQQLAENRVWRVESALQPLMRAHGIADFDRLATMVSNGRDESLATSVAEGLLNHESSFFRDPQLFGQLIDLISTRLRAARATQKRIRIWCAGCSTGQEVYSLAISFAEKAELWHGWKIEILGTDVSSNAVDRARSGVYTQFEIQRGLPVRQMLRWFDSRNEDWHAHPEITKRVKFQVHSLLDEAPQGGGFDVILCRNVLLYFAPPARISVFGRLRQAIVDDGVMMLGAGETVLGHTDLFEADPEVRGIYRVGRRGADVRAA